MESAIEQFLAGLEPGPASHGLLFLAAGIEYVFPPFPGDTIVLMGAFLVGARGWDPLPVYAAVNLGGAAGMALTHACGRFLARRDAAWRLRSPRWARLARRLDPLLPLLARRPAWYLLLNRFLPSVRALLFVAAGRAGVSLPRTLLLGGLSALLWNALLLAAGAAIGDNFERLAGLFARYNLAAWIAIGVLAGAAALWLSGRRRA